MAAFADGHAQQRISTPCTNSSPKKRTESSLLQEGPTPLRPRGSSHPLVSTFPLQSALGERKRRIDGSTRRGHDAGAIGLKVRVRKRSARWQGGATQYDSLIPESRSKEPWPLRPLSCSRRSVCALTRLLALLSVTAEIRVHMLRTVLAIRQRLGRSSLPFRCVLPPHLLGPCQLAGPRRRGYEEETWCFTAPQS